MNKNYYCVIMAGGSGSKFWPVSRNSKPKQFLDVLNTGKSFLQQTYERFIQIIPKENILIVTATSYKDIVCQQLPDITEENILLEPSRKNTAPCIAYATYKLYQKNPDATVVVAPSDHIISNENLFLNTIENILDFASRNNELFTLGVEPTRPETSYGYIQMSVKDYKNVEGHIAYGVKTFTEKPNLELAKVFVESGEFLWNSGIFIWNIKSIRKELEKWLPEIATLFEDGEKYYFTPAESSYIDKVYNDCPSMSIDYGVMEKTSKASVFKVSFGWSDMGSWDSLYLRSEKDKNNNYIRCKELMMDKVSGSIIASTEEEKLIAIKGLDNFMIINTPDVLMICPRDDVRFKNMLTDLAVNDKTKFQ
jgi:mannose-1-phosphate guanylyltransferase